MTDEEYLDLTARSTKAQALDKKMKALDKFSEYLLAQGGVAIHAWVKGIHSSAGNLDIWYSYDNSQVSALLADGIKRSLQEQRARLSEEFRGL